MSCEQLRLVGDACKHHNFTGGMVFIIALFAAIAMVWLLAAPR